MRAQKQFARLGLVAAISVMMLCMVVVIAGTFYRGDLRAALPGSVAPDFSLLDANNHPISLSQLRGNVVVVYFSPSPNSAKPPVPPPTESNGFPSTNATGRVSNITSVESPDLEQLSVLCRKLNCDSHVKVLALHERATTSPSAVMAANPLAGPWDSLSGSLSDSPADSSSDSFVHTLTDETGQVARDYKIDQLSASPTFFVIDCDGIIRYRGSFEHGTDLVDKILPAAPSHGSLMSPATEPSSCPAVVQTLLSTEAATITSPAPHF